MQRGLLYSWVCVSVKSHLTYGISTWTAFRSLSFSSNTHLHPILLKHAEILATRHRPLLSFGNKTNLTWSPSHATTPLAKPTSPRSASFILISSVDRHSSKDDIRPKPLIFIYSPCSIRDNLGTVFKDAWQTGTKLEMNTGI